MTAKAQTRAKTKYNDKAYDRLAIRIPKGEKDLVKSWAAAAGMSLAEYVRAACYEKAGKQIKKAY